MANVAQPKKYRNYAQLVQGVSQVSDPRLTPGERLFLLTLAAYTLKDDPHPGNERLMTACAITTRQGVNYIANKLVKRRLIEIVSVGNGRGRATVYRIRVEDPRFPRPKPASLDLHVSDEKEPEKRASENSETRKWESGNPQVDPQKPASLDLHTNLDSELDLESKPRESAARAASGGTSIALPDWIPIPLWSAYLKARKNKPNQRAQELLIRELDELRKQGNDPARVLEQSIAYGWQSFVPLKKSGNNRPITDDEKLGLSRFGYGTNSADRNARDIRNAQLLHRIPAGTYERIRQELLKNGETFDCERVRKLVDAAWKNPD